MRVEQVGIAGSAQVGSLNTPNPLGAEQLGVGDRQVQAPILVVLLYGINPSRQDIAHSSGYFIANRVTTGPYGRPKADQQMFGAGSKS
jgi:hypothetical protein